MASVLCIGLDDAAMKTRKLILEKSGHEVTQARDLLQVKTLCEVHSFSVAVLGQSLNSSEKMRIADTVLKYCKTAKILELHIGVGQELPSADGHLQITASEPEGLLQAVNRLVRRAGKARPRSF